MTRGPAPRVDVDRAERIVVAVLCAASLAFFVAAFLYMIAHQGAGQPPCPADVRVQGCPTAGTVR